MEKNKFAKITKITLLALIFALAVIYICQLVFTGRSKIKTLLVNEKIDLIQIDGLELREENGKWLVGEKKYPASSSKVNSLISQIKEIKLLGTASSSLKNAERYGLSDEEKIEVKAFSSGKAVRSFCVGKNTSTNSQCYLSVEGKNSVYLAQGALHTSFALSTEDLREKQIFNLDSNSVVELELKSGKLDFVLQKNIAQLGEEAPSKKWNLVKSENTDFAQGDSLDDKKVDDWVKNISSLSASEWLSDDFVFSKDPDVELRLNCGGKNYTVNLFYDSENETEIYASSSETQYAFKLQNYVANRINKNLSDLK